MFSTYDLHSHSTASDGTLSPGELVKLAAAAGVRVLALTDHDSTEGLVEAQQAATRHGISLVPGVEISVTWNKQTIHIVGLHVNPKNQDLQQGLAALRRYRDRRALEIATRLEEAGVKEAFEGARSFSNGQLISRTHFARYLVQIGAAADERKVFKHFLVNGKPGHVPGRWASLEDALGWIHGAGGQAIVAHPARYPMTRTKLRRLFREFIELKGDGIEVVSGSHSRDDYFVMAKHATELGLLASAGSDFHSPENPWIALGRLPSLPDGCRPVWEAWSYDTPAVSHLAS